MLKNKIYDIEDRELVYIKEKFNKNFTYLFDIYGWEPSGYHEKRHRYIKA